MSQQSQLSESLGHSAYQTLAQEASSLPWSNVAQAAAADLANSQEEIHLQEGVVSWKALLLKGVLSVEESFSAKLPAREEAALFVEEPVETAVKNNTPEILPETISEVVEPVENHSQTIEAVTKSENEQEVSEAVEKPASNHTLSPEPMAFEPYHTVDYFASQGIKLSSKELGTDKLGRQMRSFTDWLKTMKKLPAAATNENPLPLEQQVVHLAQHSITGKKIVTEAMAEVWAKQGNHQKAIEIYRELSLSNPGKTAYFAARIEQLKPNSL